MCYCFSMNTAKTLKEPRFTPRPGQVDYSGIRYCPVINCVLQHNDKILLVQRSESMHLYPGYWNGLSGFLDDHKSVEEKVYEEVEEEVGLCAKDIVSITRGQVIVQEAPDYDKTWIVFPVRAVTSQQTIKLAWEAASYQWVSVEEAMQLSLVPGFSEVLEILFR